MTIAKLESEMDVPRAHCQWFDRNEPHANISMR
jgi:hypothetical protein